MMNKMGSSKTEETKAEAGASTSGDKAASSRSNFIHQIFQNTFGNMIIAFKSELKRIRERPVEFIEKIFSVVAVFLASFMVWKAVMMYANTPSPVVVVLSGSMEPAFYRGDILLLKNVSKPLIGDVAIFKIEGREIPIVHRIVAFHDNSTDLYVLTKGDNNGVDDRGLYANGDIWLHSKNIIGQTESLVPHVGMLTIWLNDHVIVKWLLLIVTIYFMCCGNA